MTQQVEFAPAVASPGRLGQGTAIEQSRAVAEVQAMVVLARQFPRDTQACRGRMVDACKRIELADKAFYNYPRGGETVTGMKIEVATELATCWGNLIYGLIEMRRDDVYGQSEMQAYAWELESNMRYASTFIVPHIRDTKRGSYRVKESRDIYEVVTNMGNRRMRESIFKVLPRWFKLEAEATLRETRRKSVQGGPPIGEQIDKALRWYLDEYGIGRDQLEHKLRKDAGRWSVDEIIDLRTLGDSLKRGDLALDEAFPAAKVTVEELAADGEEPEAQASTEASAKDAGQPSGEPDGRADEDGYEQEPEAGDGD